MPLLAESLIRIPLISLLPVDVMTGLSTALLVGATILTNAAIIDSYQLTLHS